MPYVIEPQPGEVVLLDVDYPRRTKYDTPMRFVVTNQAVLIPATKFKIAGDPRYLKRIPHEEVDEIRVKRIPPYGAYFFSAIMVAVGLVALWSFLGPDARLSPKGLGYGLAILVGGILLPRAAKGQCRLIVSSQTARFTWCPPSVVDSKSKKELDDLFTKILETCKSVHIQLTDDRQAA